MTMMETGYDIPEAALVLFTAAQPEAIQVPTTVTSGASHSDPSVVTLYFWKQLDCRDVSLVG